MRSLIWLLMTLIIFGLPEPILAQNVGEYWEDQRNKVEDNWDKQVRGVENLWEKPSQEPEEKSSQTTGKSTNKTKRPEESAGPKNTNKQIVSPKSNIDEKILETVPKVGPAKKEQASGLIIDARGLGLNPLLLFQVKGKVDNTLYGPAKPELGDIKEYGMCGWACSMDEAMTDLSVGYRPVEVRAIKVENSMPKCIRIDDKDLDENLRKKIKTFFKTNSVIVIF